MLKIAHRGSSLLYGDNNMISFYEAHLNGFDIIELDVQLCSTGQIVVYHDTYINNNFIADTSFEELKLLNIPTLNDVFKSICNILSENGVLIIEDPSLLECIKKTSYDQFYNEHILIKIYIH